MIKSITTAEVRNIGEDLLPNWNDQRSQIQLSGKSMFNLIKLKKELEKHLGEIQETVVSLAEQVGGEMQPQTGSYKIPPEKVEELNEKLAEFSKEEVEIEFTPIVMTENAYLPPILMEAIFDFIEME